MMLKFLALNAVVVFGQELRKIGASALTIRGGDYDLQPVPNPSVMRRYE